MNSEQFGELVAVQGFDEALKSVLKDEREALDQRERDFNRRESYGKASAWLWVGLEVLCAVMGAVLFFGFIYYADNAQSLEKQVRDQKAKVESYRVMLLEAHVDPETGKAFGDKS